MTSPTRGERRIPLDISTTKSEGSGDLPALAAYAFSSGGLLLDSQPIDAKGNTKLSLPVTNEGDAVRVVLGPQMEKDEVSVAEVLRRGGIDSHLQLRADAKELGPVRFELTPDLIKPWLGRRCVVKGTLVKRVISGGITLELPVCNATVDIWEVDPWPWIIPRLPDLEIDRLRDIIDGPWPPIDWPVPPRPPVERFPGLGAGVLLDPLSAVALNPQPLPPRVFARSAARAASSDSALTLPTDLRIATRAARPAFERAVIANIDLLRPILCWLYPRRVTKTKIATVTTDECGHFRAVIWRSIFDFDVPDLYFTARQRLFFGFWITIYEPTPIGCYTHWNYQCGTEVRLVTTNPLAHTCPPCAPIDAPPNWVVFMAVGNTSVWRIHGANSTTAVGQPGHDPAKRGLLDDTSPWGGTLRPRLEFDNALRGSLGVKYYRVSYKRPAEPDTAWRDSTSEVTRHYIHTVGTDVVITPYPLGPNPIGGTLNLYEIPPALPPVGQWSLPDVVLDTQNAVIPTDSVAPGADFNSSGVPVGPDQGGLWQIRVDLFNTAGNQVDPEALGIAWRVPATGTLSGTIQTENAANIGLVNATKNCMIVTVNVDNNPCSASIGAPTTSNVPAGGNCGVMTWAVPVEPVVTPFLAMQRNQHATYSFYVQRGEGPSVPISMSGTAAANNSGVLSPSASVGTMLGSCIDSGIAGFTEQLYVAHMSTDGWSRQVHLDRSDVRAFVLAPAPSGP